MKFVVIGGAGFIGRHLVQSVLRCGNHKLVVLDNLSNSNLRDFHDFINPNSDFRRINKNRLTFYRLDIKNKDALKRVFRMERDVDSCIHLASRISVANSTSDPESTFATNVRGTQNVLSSACEAGVGGFVFASSAAVYGVLRLMPASEEDAAEPISLYGKSKLRGEALVNEYASKFSFATCLRIFNAYGVGQTMKYRWSNH